MKLSNKLIVGAMSIVILVLIISTSITLFFIYRQNLRQADVVLNQSMRIMRDDMDLTTKKLLTSAHQISISAEMGTKVKFMREQKDEAADFDSIMNTAREMVKSIYNNAITGNLWKVAIYDEKSELTAFVEKEADQSHFGFHYLKAGITAGTLKTGEELSLIDDSYWKKQESVAGFSMRLEETQKFGSSVYFHQDGDFLTLIAYYPITIEVFDFESGIDLTQQVGMVMAVYRFGNSFVQRLSNLTGTDINIFHGEGKSVGVTEEFGTLDLSQFTPAPADWNFRDPKIVSNDIELNGQEYKQALLPVYQRNKLIGVFSAIYSMSTASENTWEIFRIVCLVLLGCIVVVIPVAFLFSRSMTQPLVALSETLDEIEKTGKFVKRVDINSRDEIGKIGVAFNSLMDSLQFAISNLNSILEDVANSNLSGRITEDLRGDLASLKNRTNESIDMLGANHSAG